MDYLTAWQNGIPMVRSERETAETIDVYARVSDKQLIELVLTDNETAFEQIFDRYKRLVVSVAARYFRQPEQIEEIVQISFAKGLF